MKKYRLVDVYENYGVVGEYDDVDEILIAAYKYMAETDYECELRYQKRDDKGKYTDITRGVINT